MEKISIAIVGATGLVGRKVLEVLDEENIKIGKLILLASKKSANKTMFFKGKEYKVLELTEHSFDDKIDYAIFSAGSDVAKKYAPIAAKKGTIVIDNSNAFRMEKDVPLIIPEVNKEKIKENKGIIANPNCSTIQALVAIKPLYDKYRIKRIVYSTYQAVSGAGKKGLDDLNNGILKYANKDNPKFNYKLQKFEYEIFNNCLPQIDIFMENGYTREEMKMINETRKILDDKNLKITATCVRVPVFNSHSESINIEFKDDINMDEILKALKKQQNLKIINGKKYLYPINSIANEKNEVFIGRIRRDESVKNGINIWVVADNIRKGAATNAVQILEELIKNKN